MCATKAGPTHRLFHATNRCGRLTALPWRPASALGLLGTPPRSEAGFSPVIADLEMLRVDPGRQAAAVVVAPGRLGQMCWGGCCVPAHPSCHTLPADAIPAGVCGLFCSVRVQNLDLVVTFFPNFAPHFPAEVLQRRPGRRRRWSQLIDCVARRSEPTPPCLGHPIGAVQPFQRGQRVV